MLWAETGEMFGSLVSLDAYRWHEPIKRPASRARRQIESCEHANSNKSRFGNLTSTLHFTCCRTSINALHVHVVIVSRRRREAGNRFGSVVRRGTEASGTRVRRAESNGSVPAILAGGGHRWEVYWSETDGIDCCLLLRPLLTTPLQKVGDVREQMQLNKLKDE